MNKGFYWHVHHDNLVEWCYNYQERVEAIKEKPKNEIKTRLRLFKPIKDVKALPKELFEAYKKRYEGYEKWYEAHKKWDEACKKFMPKLEALHKKDCGCKEWNGKE